MVGLREKVQATDIADTLILTKLYWHIMYYPRTIAQL